MHSNGPQTHEVAAFLEEQQVLRLRRPPHLVPLEVERDRGHILDQHGLPPALLEGRQRRDRLAFVGTEAWLDIEAFVEIGAPLEIEASLGWLERIVEIEEGHGDDAGPDIEVLRLEAEVVSLGVDDEEGRVDELHV